MKKGLLIFAGLALVGSLFIYIKQGVYADEGYGWKGSRFGGRGLEMKAEFFGMSVEDLQAALKNQTPLEIAEGQGKTKEDMFEFMKGKMVERMQDRGLSEEEIAERLARMEERHAQCLEDPESCRMGMRGGIHKGECGGWRGE
ncbi:hypothetical protein ACFL13_01980 [Patescibacteria group bacterium]